MATGSDRRGVVGYNVQAAADTQHHIVAHTVTNRGHDGSHLLEMAKAAQSEFGSSEMIALADRGYYEGEQIRACAEAGIAYTDVGIIATNRVLLKSLGDATRKRSASAPATP